MEATATRETALSAFAPERRRTAAPARRAWTSLGRWLLAALHAYSRRQVARALGAFNQAIRNGAEARLHIESRKENHT